MNAILQEKNAASGLARAGLAAAVRGNIHYDAFAEGPITFRSKENLESSEKHGTSA